MSDIFDIDLPPRPMPPTLPPRSESKTLRDEFALVAFDRLLEARWQRAQRTEGDFDTMCELAWKLADLMMIRRE